MPSLTALEVADLVRGELIGRGEIAVASVAPLERAGPGELTLLASSRYVSYFERSNAGAALITPEFKGVAAGPATRIVVRDPLEALHHVLGRLYPEPVPSWGIHPTAIVGRRTRWAGRVAIGPHTIIGADVLIGAECVIASHARIEDGARLGAACRVGCHTVIHAGTRLGRRVVVHSGARIGNSGFRFTSVAGRPERVAHVGCCIVDDDVEIGANSTVDRGSIGDTVIGAETKIDNLVHVAHNVRIGARCMILAQVGVAGSSAIEDDVHLGGQAGIAGHLRVGRGARVAAQSGVIGDIPDGETVSGYPARSHRAVLRQVAALARLTPLVGRIERVARDAGPE